MKTRTYQELYNYLFGNHADVAHILTNTPEEYKEKQLAHKLGKITAFFFDEENPLIPSQISKSFRIILRQIKAEKLEKIIFENTTDEIDDDSDPYFRDVASINTRFNKLNKEYLFFNKKSSQQLLEQYQAYYYICKFIREFIEDEDVGEEAECFSLDAERAFKMLVIFGDTQHVAAEAETSTTVKNYFKHFDQFIASHGLFEKERPLHDIFLWPLPKNTMQAIQLNAWRQIILTAGRRALRLFSKAREIEEKLSGKAPRNYQEAFEIGKTITFQNASADIELANLCMHYDVKEDIFERCLELKKSIKETDDLPNVIINGDDKDINYPGYYLAKLPAKDPRAFILGHITDCCQSIGGHSEDCVIDGITRKNNGFYVLLKKKSEKILAKSKTKTQEFKETDNSAFPFDYSKFDIVGQGYAWLSSKGNLTFDSWENLRESDDAIIVKMLTQFGKEVTEAKDSTILRVTIGKGGKTPREFKTDVEFPESMREGKQYSDSEQQKLVYCKISARQKLLSELPLQLQHDFLLWQRPAKIKPLHNITTMIRQKL